MKHNVEAIILAGGSGRRISGEVSKQYIEVGGRPILRYTCEKFQRCIEIDVITVVVPEGDVERMSRVFTEQWGLDKVHRVVAGGEERIHSVWAALTTLGEDVEIVVIHDGVRPFVNEAHIVSTIETAVEFGAAVVGVPPTETIKRIRDGLIESTPARQSLVVVQTPQTFRKDLIVRAYRHAIAHGIEATDDAMLVELLGEQVRVVQGDYRNIKITLPEDLLLAEAILKAEIDPQM